MRNTPRAWLLLATLLSCQEPTQITVTVTTNALCKGPGAVVLEGMGIAATAKFPPQEETTFTGTRDDCDKEATPRSTIGSLVLVPAADREGSLVEVLVVGGFETDDGKPTQTAESCETMRASAGIDGLNCIVARRRLGFVDALPLSLPLDLDTSCLGVECGEDLTCFQGNCVSPDVDCDEGGNCEPPQGGGGSGAGGSGAGGEGGAPGGGGAGADGGGGSPPLEICNNGVNDDADADADCADEECSATLYCTEPNSVVLNELSIESVDDSAEFIEIYNRSAAAIDLTGASVVLTEGPAGDAAISYTTISLDGVMLGGGDYLVLHDSTLTPPPSAMSIAFEGAADTDHVRQPEGMNAGAVALHLTGSSSLIDAVVYHGVPAVVLIDGVPYSPTPYVITSQEDPTGSDSLSRIPNGQLGAADAIWTLTTSVTLGQTNMVSAGTENCSNGVDDDDVDLLSDCADTPECDGAACGPNGVVCNAGNCSCPGGSTETNCFDGLDGDCDGSTDCADSNCAVTPACTEVCNNQMDDQDPDFDADCLDSECAGQSCGLNGRVCMAGVCDCPGMGVEMCNTGDDEDCDNLIDCQDPDCAMVCGEVCSNGMDDNDPDALADCADTADCPMGASCGLTGQICSTTGMCQCPGGGTEVCGNSMDDDCDLMVDCADSNCFSSPACTGSTVVASFQPPVATRTGKVRIVGSGFTGVTQVWIGNVPHLHSIDSDTSITIPIVQEGVPLGVQSVSIFKGANITPAPGLTVVDLLVKQLDAQTSSPSLDFLQLQIGVPTSVPLSGYVVTFFHGNGPAGANRVSTSLSLTGTTTPAGTYLLASAGFSVAAQQTLPAGLDIPGGTHAVAIHQSDVAFPPNTMASITGLIDALVFDGSVPDPSPTLNDLFMLTDAIISEGPSPNVVSLQRCGLARRDAAQFQGSSPTPDYMTMVASCTN